MAGRLLSNRVEQVLEDLSEHTGHGGIFYPFKESETPVVGRGVCRFCSRCVGYVSTAGYCRNSSCTAAIQGHAMGDVWYFRCWLGIDSLAVPLAPRGEIVGTIEVGGFFSPGGAEEALSTILSRLNTLAPGSLGQLPVGALQGVRELNFKQVEGIANFLIEATFAAGLNLASQFQTRKRIHAQQERLARRMQDLARGRQSTHVVFLACLAPLLDHLQTGDRKGALSALDNFLGAILMHSQGRVDDAKAGLALLLAALFREDVASGRTWKKAMHRFEERLLDLERSECIEDAFLWIEDTVARATPSGGKQASVDPRGERLSDRVLTWLERNYARKTSLREAAEAVAASPSTITHKLKTETSRTFGEHLATLRVSEAKRLLAYTDLTLAEISHRCGFSDQSYFTKVFRRAINLTPGEFRGMLDRKA